MQDTGSHKGGNKEIKAVTQQTNHQSSSIIHGYLQQPSPAVNHVDKENEKLPEIDGLTQLPLLAPLTIADNLHQQTFSAEGGSMDSLISSPASFASLASASESPSHSRSQTNWIQYLKTNRTRQNASKRKTIHVIDDKTDFQALINDGSNGDNSGDQDYNESLSSSSRPISQVLTQRDREQLLPKRLSDLPALPFPSNRFRIIKVHELTDGDDLLGSHSAELASNQFLGEYRSIQVPCQARVVDAMILVLKKWRYLTAEQIARIKSAETIGDGDYGDSINSKRLSVSDELRKFILSEGWEMLQLERPEFPPGTADNRLDRKRFTILHPDTALESLGDYFIFRKNPSSLSSTGSSRVMAMQIGSDYQPSLKFTSCALYKLDSREPPANSIKPLARVSIRHWHKRYAVVGKGDRHLLLFSSEQESKFLASCMHDVDLEKVQFCEPFPIFMTAVPSMDGLLDNNGLEVDVASFGVKLQTRTRRIFFCFRQENARDLFMTEVNTLRMELFARDKRPAKSRQLAQIHSLFTRSDSDQSAFSVADNSNNEITSTARTDAAAGTVKKAIETDLPVYLSPTQRLVLRLESSRRLNDIDWPPFDSVDEAQRARWNHETNSHLFKILRERVYCQLKRMVDKYQLVSGDDFQVLVNTDNMLDGSGNINGRFSTANGDSSNHSSNQTIGTEQSGGNQVVQSVKKFIKGLGSLPASTAASPNGDNLQSYYSSSPIVTSGSGEGISVSLSGSAGNLSAQQQQQQQQPTLFGVPLAVLSSRSDVNRTNCPHLPPLIDQTLQYLTGRAPQTSGIFRLAGSIKRMDALKRQFEQQQRSAQSPDNSFDFSPFQVHDVAGVFKQFLRDLPDPLLTGRLYRFFIAAEKLEQIELKRQYFRLLTMLLPPVNRLLLERLLVLLHAIAACSEDHQSDPQAAESKIISGNLMNTSNLGVVIGPNILRDSGIGGILDEKEGKIKLKAVNDSNQGLAAQSEASDNAAIVKTVKCLIEEHQLLFIIPEEMIEQLKLHVAIPIKYDQSMIFS